MLRIRPRMNPEIIHKKAKALRKREERSLMDLAEAIGLHVYLRQDFDHLYGMYVIIQRRRCIFLNANLDELETSWVLAHEIGHDQLHKDLALQNGLQDLVLLDMKSKPEYEANAFAAHLLIGDEEIDDLVYQGASLLEMAQSLYVPLELVQIKLREMVKLGKDYPLPDAPKANFIGHL